MSYRIVCPYCFEEMSDEQVLSRSELVTKGESDIIPDEYDDLEDFIARYRGSDKEKILSMYKEWEFFSEKSDSIYDGFWEKFNGTTEYNPADDILQIKAYRRPIIDPNDKTHQKYLRKKGDDYFIRDSQGMVSQIELKSGERCNRRVCKFCHNPLPDNYGKNNVKFASVIGITGAGKTVYLSQLLRKMKTYTVHAGLSAIVNNSGVVSFLEKNVVAANKPLPSSTPATRFQQPLFYELVRANEAGGKITETFVLYDVAGEVFTDSALVNRFAPFIEHADGVIVLIDPMQFEAINGTSSAGKALDEPTTVLEIIHHIISHEALGSKCSIPFAICLSKADTQAVQSVFSDNLKQLLLEQVHGIQDVNGYYLPIFNAKEYAPIAKELLHFIQSEEITLAQTMMTNYSSYAYFAFTALGCDVAEGVRENGERYQYPVGPVLPIRIEEPLLWLFYKFGYIGKNADLPGEIFCPMCGSLNTREIPESERHIVEKHGLFKKKNIYVNRCCVNCGHKWEYISAYD